MLPGTAMNAASTSGDAVEVASDIGHANGGIYDQVLLRGPVGTVEADPGQMTRVSFLDLTDDIVQVEFSGAGSLTVSLEDFSGPMAPAKYNQPGIEYMRGHASIAITGADATTNVSVFSVGRINAVNQTLFRDGVTYDGFADIARIEIVAATMQRDGTSAFGGIRAGNVRFFATEGITGIYAPAVRVQGPVIVGDVAAYDDAIPVLWFDDGSQFGRLSVAGGSLLQPNGQAIQTKGFETILMVSGTSSLGVYLGAQSIQGRIERDGADVTNGVVLYPASAIAITGVVTATAQVAVGSTVAVAATGPIEVAPVTAVPSTPTVPVDPIIVTPGGG